MTSAIELTIGQQFEIERLNRVIDETADPEQLRQLAKQLLQAWHTQKAATNWMISQHAGAPRPSDL
ncbi:MAG: hypothetical protein ACKN89_03760 [Cyanobium sp.]|jgi:hypothetical protein